MSLSVWQQFWGKHCYLKGKILKNMLRQITHFICKADGGTPWSFSSRIQRCPDSRRLQCCSCDSVQPGESSHKLSSALERQPLRVANIKATRDLLTMQWGDRSEALENRVFSTCLCLWVSLAVRRSSSVSRSNSGTQGGKGRNGAMSVIKDTYMYRKSTKAAPAVPVSAGAGEPLYFLRIFLMAPAVPCSRHTGY